MKSRLLYFSLFLISIICFYHNGNAQVVVSPSGDTLRIISNDTINDGFLQPIGFYNSTGEIFHSNDALAGKFSETGTIYDENSEEIGYVDLSTGEIKNFEDQILGYVTNTSITLSTGVQVCSFQNVDRILVSAITFFLLR